MSEVTEMFCLKLVNVFLAAQICGGVLNVECCKCVVVSRSLDFFYLV